MKVNVYVTLKPGVLDPQGKAIHHALEGLGFSGVADVRAGLAALRDRYDAVNIKLDKCGGLTEGLAIARAIAESERYGRPCHS